MLTHALRAERLKQTRSPVWLAFFVLPIISAFFGTFNYLGNLGVLENGWYSLWSQHTLFLCAFFFPALIAVYCAWLWRIEHFGNNWNARLTSPVSFRTQYLAKLCFASSMVAIALLWQTLLYVLCGKLAGITAPLPPALLSWVGCGILGGIAICALQLFLSLVIRSFALPVVIAMLGGILGLYAINKDIGILVIYSLNSIGMRANNPWRALAYPFGVFCAACILYVIVLLALSIFYVSKKDM